MAGINKVIIVGNLGNAPEMRAMPNGEAVASFSVATSEEWTDKTTNEKKSITEWHRITTYRKLAEICGQYLRKGSKVYIEGRLRTRKWQDQTGADRYTTEIIADTMQMLDSKNSVTENQYAQTAGAPTPENNNFNQAPTQTQTSPKTKATPVIDQIEDDNIPF